MFSIPHAGLFQVSPPTGMQISLEYLAVAVVVVAAAAAILVVFVKS